MSRLTTYVLACILTLAGAAAFDTSAQATTDLPIDRTVTFRSTPSSPYSDATVSMSGQVSPAASGAVVWLQQEGKPGFWRTVATVHTTATGKYAGKFTVHTVGVRHLRAYLPASATGHAASSQTRRITVVAKPHKTFKTVRPTVGTLEVGHKLTVKTGKWTPRPSKFSYRWRRGGGKISGATKSTYVLTPADLGAYVTVEVTASRSGQHTIRESTTSSVVRPDTFASATPTITGTPVVGDPLAADAGGWSPTPEAFTYQWSRNQQPIAGATTSTYTPTMQDVGEGVTVSVTAHRNSFAPLTTTSAAVEITAPAPDAPPPPTPTFGELMQPESTTVLPASDATVTFTDHEPSWYAHNQEIRWDTPGAFTHSLDPLPYDTLFTASMTTGVDYRNPAIGAEYHVNNSTYKNADIRFTVTGKEFAIRYWTFKQSDAMVWIDDQPVAAHPFAGTDTSGSGSWNWLVVTRTSGAPADVRFAGPLVFTGVDHDSRDDVTVTAAPRFTLGVISDSDFEETPDTHPMTQAAGPMLSTLTGFRIWNMAEGGTGYVNDGTGNPARGGAGDPGNLTSPFGSTRRIASIATAPIDALLVNGSVNDLAWSADVQRDAMDAFLDKVAQVRPDLPVVLVGIEPLSYANVDDQTNPLFRALDANFATVAARHANVVGVIDPYAADWLTGTGSTAHPTGVGNQDEYIGADGMHLNATGQAYYQGRIADELRPFLAGLARPTA